MSGIPQLHLPSLQKKEQKPRSRFFFSLVDVDAAFAAAIARPRPLLSLVVAALIALAPPVAFLVNAERSGGAQQVLLNEAKKHIDMKKIPPEARANFEKVVVPAIGVLLPAGAVAKRLVWISFCSVVCFAFLRGTRKGMRLSTTIACCVVGASPLFLHDVATAIVFSTYDLQGIDTQNAIGSNPAAWLFAGKDTRSPLAMALRGVDFFELWACAWMAAGITRAAGGRTSLPLTVTLTAHALLTAIAALGARS